MVWSCAAVMENTARPAGITHAALDLLGEGSCAHVMRARGDTQNSAGFHERRRQPGELSIAAGTGLQVFAGLNECRRIGDDDTETSPFRR